MTCAALGDDAVFLRMSASEAPERASIATASRSRPSPAR